MILVSLSLNRKFAVAGGMVTWKFVAFRWPRVFRLIVPGVAPVVLVTEPLPVPTLVPVVVVVWLKLSINVTVALVGGLITRSCNLSRFTCMIATSTTTSGRD